MSYSFLLEMAWKSAAISGAALLLVTLLRSRSAADRGALLRVGIAMLLMLPLLSALFPSLVVETAASETAAPLMAAAPTPPPLAAASAHLAEAPYTSAAAAPAADTGFLAWSSDWNDPGILFLILYLGGLAMVAGRLVAGLLTLHRWTADAREVTGSEWQAALARASADAGPAAEGVRLLASPDARSPLSWGWRRPAILLDSDTLRHPEDADAILAHEIAHIVRRDWPTLIASRLAVALFWFNPLVWRLDREIVHHAEEAADSFAAARVEPTRYAQTLLDWARETSGLLPANAMAASEPGLSRRVRALLDGRAGRRSGSFWTFAAMAACAAVAAPVAALEFVPEAPPAPEAPEAPEAPQPPESRTFVSALAPVAPARPTDPAAPAALPVPPAPGAAVPPVGDIPAPRAPIRGLVALALAPRHPEPIVDGQAIAAEVEAAVAEALRHAEFASIDGERIAREAKRAAKEAMREGAAGMMHGADEMEEGAEEMRREAGKLRNRDYRERQIAKAKARGEDVTHEELIEAADDLEEGAREMRGGARDMRKAAKDMAREG